MLFYKPEFDEDDPVCSCSSFSRFRFSLSGDEGLFDFLSDICIQINSTIREHYEK
jgi:hypothetical protein